MFAGLCTTTDRLSGIADKVFKASGKFSGYTDKLVIIPNRAVKTMENIFTIAESVFVMSDGFRIK